MRREEDEVRAAATPRPEGRAAQAAWQEAADLGVDLAAAIKAACESGALSGLSLMVLYLVYFDGAALEDVAQRLQVSYDRARRLRRGALRAIRDTGLLAGYMNEGDASTSARQETSSCVTGGKK